jgi:prepilin-type N-terminal cleavage/methylation domain-containing protein
MARQRASRTSINQTGFTIVELLIVVVVIAILAAITIVAYNGIQQRARASAVQSDIAQAVRKIEIAKTEGGLDTYPADLPSGFTPSQSSEVSYSFDPVINRYCVTVTNGEISYFASTSNTTPQEGTCSEGNRLVGWWPLNGNTQDISGTGNDGAAYSVTSASGQKGVADTAFYFDGTSNSIRTGSSLSEADDLFASEGMSWTTTVWFKYLPRTGYPDLILGRGGGTGSSATYGLYMNGSNYLTAVLRGNTTVIGSSPIEDSDWHFAAITWDGTTALGYIDDQTPTTLGVNPPGLQTETFVIGATNGGNNSGTTRSFRGYIDDVRVYSRSVSASELAAMYRRGAN